MEFFEFFFHKQKRATWHTSHTALLLCHLLFGPKSIFGSVFQAFNIGAMQPDYHLCHNHTAKCVKKNGGDVGAENDPVNQGHYREQRCHDDASQRYNMRKCELDQEHQQQDSADDRTDGKRRTGANQHAFAAFKTEIQGGGCGQSCKRLPRDRRRI